MSSPRLCSEAAIGEVLRDVLGSRTAVQIHDWHKRTENYVVVSVETRRPAMRLIVKLEELYHGSTLRRERQHNV